MPAMQQVHRTKLVTSKQIVLMAAGGILGATVGFGVMRFAQALDVSAKSMTWSDFLAVWIGVTFVGVGAATYGVSFNRRELAKNLEGQKAKLPATAEEVRTTRLQAITLMLAGVMMLLPIMALGSLAKTPNAPELIFAGIVVLLGFQTRANVQLWKGADEFLRSQMLLTGAVTFAICQALLFLWAAAEHLHLARPISSWDVITVLMTIYISAGAYLTIRNRPTC